MLGRPDPAEAYRLISRDARIEGATSTGDLLIDTFRIQAGHGQAVLPGAMLDIAVRNTDVEYIELHAGGCQ